MTTDGSTVTSRAPALPHVPEAEAAGDRACSIPRTLIDALDECHLVGDVRGYSFIDPAGETTTFGFRTLVDEARRRGRQLAALGLRKGDRVALVIPGAEDFVLTFLGAVTRGIVPVPLYPPLSLGRLDAYLGGMVRTLNAAAVDLVVATSQVQKILWSVLPRVPSARDMITVEALASKTESDAPAPEIAPTDPVFLQFTSGSTATPKGVIVTHASLCANAHRHHARLASRPTRRSIARSRGCRSITTWASSASCSRRS